MALTIDVNYFNSFYLKRVYGTGKVQFGASAPVDGNIPYAYEQGWLPIEGTIIPVTGIRTWRTSDDSFSNFVFNTFSGSTELDWCIEEARIRGGFNNTSVDFGVKAYIVEDNPNQQRLSNTVIYSGIFNARTGVNNTNQFSVGEEITRGVDPISGSIQRLYAEDTNLIVFQERKVNVALIDKDAIFTAEGLGISTTGRQVIGQITPVPGNWGIGKNPESFAVYGYTKYFADKEQNAVLKMEGTNIQEISLAGMTDFFRDRFNELGPAGRLVGGYDIYNKNYVLSLQNSSDILTTFPAQGQDLINNTVDLSGDTPTGYTLSWDERAKGWTGFATYTPNNIFSCIGKFYSTNFGKVYEHYSNPIRNSFYGLPAEASIVQFVFNPNPNITKTFKTINYEGSNGWDVLSIESDNTGEIEYPIGSGIYKNYNDDTTGEVREADGAGSGVIYNQIYSYQEGAYSENGIQYRAGFDRKQNKYYAVIPNNTQDPIPGEVIWGNQTMGIKGYYTTVTMSTDETTNLGGPKALFAASSEYINK